MVPTKFQCMVGVADMHDEQNQDLVLYPEHHFIGFINLKCRIPNK